MHLNLDIPIWLIRGIIATIAFIVVVSISAKYKDRKGVQVPVIITVCALIWAGLYWLITFVG